MVPVLRLRFLSGNGFPFHVSQERSGAHLARLSQSGGYACGNKPIDCCVRLLPFNSDGALADTGTKRASLIQLADLGLNAA
jgi:hypothetical protein